MSYALKRRLGYVGLIATLAGGMALLNGPAQAAGCNGHVNQFEWGCAAWDNNNGPQFPHYVKPATTSHAAPAPLKVAPKVAAPPPAPHLAAPPPVARNGGGIMTNSSGNAISNNGSALISPGNRNGVVSQGGGNLISPGNRNGVVSQGGGNLISPGNRNGVVSQGAGNVVSQGAGNFKH